MAVTAGISFFALSVMILDSAVEVVNKRYPVKYLVWFLTTFAVFLITKYLSLRFGNDLIERTMENERNRLGNLIRHSELQFIEQTEKGRIYTRMTLDIKRVSLIFRSGINLIQGVSVFLAIWVYFLFTSVQAAVLLFAMVVIYIILQKTIDPVIREKGGIAMKSETRLFAFFGHVIHGFKELKQNQRKSSDFFLNYLRPLVKQTETRRVDSNEEFVRLVVSTNALAHLSMGMMIFVLDFGSADLTLKLFVMYGFLIQSIAIILSNLPEVMEANVAISRISELEEELKQSIKKGPVSVPQKTTDFKEINIKDLVFDYTDKNGDTTFSLGPVNYTIKNSEIIFLTGGNGGGKSTLLKLISGLYPPLSGGVTLDDGPCDIREHQHLFSAIFTDCFLFDRLYGVDRPDENKIKELLIAMGLSNKVRWENGAMNYHGLSSGQQKRLAFIVSLLEDKSIYIFDEWAAEQDPVFRKTFYETLLPAMKANGKTVIAASHDDRYFHVADKILKLNYGIPEDTPC